MRTPEFYLFPRSDHRPLRLAIRKFEGKFIEIMKRQTFLKAAATVFLFLVVCFNAGSLRAEPQADSLSNAKRQAMMDDRALVKSGDEDPQEEKSQRFKKLEWLIMQSLMNKYQKLEGVGEEEEEYPE